MKSRTERFDFFFLSIMWGKTEKRPVQYGRAEYPSISSSLVCIYCFYYLFLNRDISFRHKYDCPRRAAILSLHVGQAYCPGTRWASRLQGQRVLTMLTPLIGLPKCPTSRRSACPFMCVRSEYPHKKDIRFVRTVCLSTMADQNMHSRFSGQNILPY